MSGTGEDKRIPEISTAYILKQQNRRTHMKAFLFDIDDTLYDQVQPFARAYDAVFGEKYEVDVQALFVRSRKRSDEVYEMSLRGEMSMEDMYVYRIQKAFEDLNVLISREDALAFQNEYGKNQSRIEMSDTIMEMLDFCKGKAALGIVTNGPDKHQWNKVHALGLTKWIPESNVFVSGALGVAKPDPDIFQIAMERMDIGADSYYIGDSFRNDIVGASGAGLKTIWLNRRGHVTDDRDVIPDYIVTSEEQLYELLQNLMVK